MPDPIPVIFRADASPAIGGGHVIRCMALGGALRDAGHDVSFATGSDTLATVPALADAGFRIVETRAGERLVETLSRAEAAGIGLIVDHYGIAADDVSACRAQAAWIGVIDDLAAGPHEADFVVNQTMLEPDYRGLLPRHAIVKAGPEFALLRPEFAALRDPAVANRRRRRRLQRIFASFGLTDSEGWAPWLAETLGSTPYELDLAIGSAAATLPGVLASAKRHRNVSVHVDSPDVARLMAESDLAIGAAGSTSWERCCLGLPSILVVAAENQRPIARYLATKGAADTIDRRNRDSLPDLIRALAGDPARLAAMAEAALALCDGRGARRVAEFIGAGLHAGLSGGVAVRAATEADRADFWLVRNEPSVRARSGNGSPVPWEAHVAWWSRALADSRNLLLAAELDGRIVGYVRFSPDDASGTEEVSIALSPAARGRGLGAAVLRQGLDRLFEERPEAVVHARVDETNAASLRLFSRCGFVQRGREGRFIVWERKVWHRGAGHDGR